MKMKTKNEILQGIMKNIHNKPNVVVEITTTNKCNCRCKYCFENGSFCNSEIENDEKTRQLNLLVDLCEKFDPIRFNSVNIIFWGGEPLCNISFIKEIIDCTFKYDYVTYFMYTNGTLVDETKQLIDHLKSRRISFRRFSAQLSYDGEPHHSLLRANNSQQIFESARCYRDAGYEISFKATLMFNMVSYFPDMWKSYEKLYDEFGKYVKYSPTLDTTNVGITDALYEQWEKSVLQVMKYEYQFIKNHGHALLSWMQYKDDKRTCNLNYHISLATSGNIYLCHGCQYIQHNDAFLLGNTKELASLYDVIDKRLHDVGCTKECLQCGAVFCNVCHVSYIEDGDYDKKWKTCRASNKHRCKFFKFFGKAYEALQLALIDT